MDVLLIACLAAGILAGIFVPIGPKLRRASSIIQNVLLFALIFLMGFALGNNKELIRNLGTLGFNALVFAALCAVGSFFATTLLIKLLRKSR